MAGNWCNWYFQRGGRKVSFDKFIISILSVLPQLFPNRELAIELVNDKFWKVENM